MIKIYADQLEAGMKLAKPIMAGSGIVLLSAGMELSASWIERLQDMSVESVYIEGTAPNPVSKEEILLQVDKKFKNVENKPYMALLKKAVQKHIVSLYE